MEIYEHTLISLASEGRITLQIPQYVADLSAAFGGPASPAPKILTIPDDWIVTTNCGRSSKRMKKIGFSESMPRPAIGKQSGFWHFSKKGWLANKDKLKKAFEASSARRYYSSLARTVTWKDFEAYADAFYKDMKDEATYAIKKKQAEIAELRAAKKGC